MKLQSLKNSVSLLFLITFQPYLSAQENAQENKLPCDIVEEEVLENTPQDTVELITAFNPAQPVERVHPTFPSSAVRVNAEGWVQMSYVIDKDGNVQDPMIEDSGQYFHKLARNKFAFANIQGQVDTVEVRCKTRREKFTVAEDFVWSIPQTWGECQVVVQGDTETKFDLVEVSAS